MCCLWQVFKVFSPFLKFLFKHKLYILLSTPGNACSFDSCRASSQNNLILRNMGIYHWIGSNNKHITQNASLLDKTVITNPAVITNPDLLIGIDVFFILVKNSVKICINKLNIPGYPAIPTNYYWFITLGDQNAFCFLQGIFWQRIK